MEDTYPSELENSPNVSPLLGTEEHNTPQNYADDYVTGIMATQYNDANKNNDNILENKNYDTDENCGRIETKLHNTICYKDIREDTNKWVVTRDRLCDLESGWIGNRPWLL